MSEASSVELSDVIPRSLIAKEIWGPSTSDAATEERIDSLRSFFMCYQNEHDFENNQYEDIFAAIRTLRRSPEARKSDLRREGDAATTPSNDAEAVLLDSTVRSIFLTACTRRMQPGDRALSGGAIFRPYWKESESLVKYLDRVFPRALPPQQDLLNFKADKLRASYLQAYASIQIEWTNYLSDHLVLLRGESWKKLFVFQHPGFIKVSLERLAASEEGSTQTHAEAVKLGCLPPALLKETLLTLNLIFPLIGDHASRTILEKHVSKHGLDRYLLDYFYSDARDHECPGDAIEPRDIKSLYEKYPYWADRLYDIWREADDPTPITRIERWTEARKNPRFTYWCAVVSIILAVTFGMLSTILAGAQLWIAWCDWVDDPTVAQCGFKRSGGE